MPIWPGEVATVEVRVNFVPTHNPFNGEDHRMPTDVTQRYKYGSPDCTMIDGMCLVLCFVFLSTLSQT